MEYNGIVIPALVVGLVEVVKQTGINSKYIPTISLFIGLTFGVGIAYFTGADTLAGVLDGLALGLSAIGLYSGTKNTFQKEEL